MRALAAIALLLATASAAAADPAAEIVALDGNGDFREVQQPGWLPAKVKQSLFPTNFVRTGDQSRMGLLFVDRTQLRLAPNSVLQIKEAAKGADAKTILNLNSGRSWVQSKAAPKGLVMETPSALAAIRGTDWEMAVDADGRSTLSVFSGEVDLSNEFGAVVVQRGEQARAEKGKAPVKLQITVSRDRMQWVSSLSIDPERYKGTQGADLLQQADVAAFDGDMATAVAALEKGGERFPKDARFPAGLVRLALLAGDAPRALALARQAVAAHAGSADAWLALGDAARLEGLGAEAAFAYERAIEIAAGDARGWHGLGVVEGERGELRRARSDLAKALALKQDAATAAELGTVEALASNLAEARAAFARALEWQPDHYVAWTGLGILQLRGGERDAAIESLLKAGVIEPRYARAHLYLAAAYYQEERFGAARDELRRAQETDPKDPLPRLFASLMRLDAIDPIGAAAEAREALSRIPFLKSLDAIADNQKGIANVGAPLAALGLEDWARSAAHDSYLPSWGGSHLFLADRYPGEFSRRAELMQGFTTDPLAFGASNRFQSLVPVPGHHATASLRYSHSDDLDVTEPVLTANGLGFAGAPFAYFVEGIDTRVRPGHAELDGKARTLTAAFGTRPVHELSLFVYLNRLTVDLDIGSADPGRTLQHIDGTSDRIDAGARYAISNGHDVWVKAGASREDTRLDQVSSLAIPGQPLEVRQFFAPKPERRDAAVRYTGRWDAAEVTLGAEGARWEAPATLVRDATLHAPGAAVAKESLDQKDDDRSRTVYAIARFGNPALSAEVGAAWRSYRKDRDATVTLANGTVVVQEAGVEDRRTDPLVGVVWKPLAGHTGRFACRDWLRPASLDTLMPVAVAGIPVQDQLVFAGGKLRQCRAQWDWTISPTMFASVHYEDDRTKNLVGSDGILNTRTDVTNLDRLRNRVLTPPGRTDELEDAPVYAEAHAKFAHVAFESILTRSLALRLHYTHANTRNTDPDPAFNGNRIPWVPRHRADAGLVVTPGWNTIVTLGATWRSERFVDEANTASATMPKGWDGRVNVFVESRDKRWAVEAFAYNLLKKDVSDVFGVVASWRF